MMQATICQALPVIRPVPSKAAPTATGPLARPHGFSQARRTVPYAFNPALDSFGDGMGVPMASFVRPDCPPDAEDISAAPQKKEKRGKAVPQGARPQFRSALEQVQSQHLFHSLVALLAHSRLRELHPAAALPD